MTKSRRRCYVSCQRPKSSVLRIALNGFAWSMECESGRWSANDSENTNNLEASKMNTRNLARYSRLCASARIVAALVFIIAGSIAAFGQQITGSIVGTVNDQQGAVV